MSLPIPGRQTMSGKKHNQASPDASTENQPKRKVARFQESYRITGASTPIANTKRPSLIRIPTSGQHFRHVLPKPAFAPSEGYVPVDVAPLGRLVSNQVPQVHQAPAELLLCTTASQSTLSQGSGVTPYTTRADTRGLVDHGIQAEPRFPSTTDAEFPTIFVPASNADTVQENPSTTLDLFCQVPPLAATPWGTCCFCDDLWRNHRESMVGLLRAQGAGAAGFGMDSTPVAINIFSSYFAFQEHVARSHGWSLGG